MQSLGAGFDVLTAMERVPVDADDRPEQEIKITGASVFVNPYKEMEEEEQKQADAERRKVCSQGGWLVKQPPACSLLTSKTSPSLACQYSLRHWRYGSDIEVCRTG